MTSNTVPIWSTKIDNVNDCIYYIIVIGCDQRAKWLTSYGLIDSVIRHSFSYSRAVFIILFSLAIIQTMLAAQVSHFIVNSIVITTT